MDSIIITALRNMITRQLGQRRMFTKAELLAQPLAVPHGGCLILSTDKLPKEVPLHVTRRGVAWPPECHNGYRSRSGRSYPISAELLGANFASAELLEHTSQPELDALACKAAEEILAEVARAVVTGDMGNASATRARADAGYAAYAAMKEYAIPKPVTFAEEIAAASRVEIYLGVNLEIRAEVGDQATVTVWSTMGIVCPPPQAAPQ
jgi:hypothetical protein